ncbi:MAG TPA: hypothetical protein VIW47_03415 [Nitrospiraceae bacterium]|jgi:hypothetical protein
MIQTDFLDSAILDELAQVGSCSLEELNERLPYYSWNQVFSAVERLKREGSVALKNPAPFLCIVTLAPHNIPQVHTLT